MASNRFVIILKYIFLIKAYINQRGNDNDPSYNYIIKMNSDLKSIK